MRTRRLPAGASKERLAAVPVVLVGLCATFFAGSLLVAARVSPGAELGLTLESVAGVELWRLVTFPLSVFSGVGVADGGFWPAMVASVLVFVLGVCVIAAAGRRAEARVGSLGLAGAMVGAAVAHGLLALLVFRLDSVFSPAAIAVTVLTVCQLARLERRDEECDRAGDLSLMLGGFLVLVVLVAAAFDAGFVPAAVGLLAGPAVGIATFTMVRSQELWRLESEGTGTVAGVLFADDTELLTVEELRDSTDKLLEQISVSGMQSLDRKQRLFLARASVRLKQMQGAGSGDGQADVRERHGQPD